MIKFEFLGRTNAKEYRVVKKLKTHLYWGMMIDPSVCGKQEWELNASD
jgi:hypothetical protein